MDYLGIPLLDWNTYCGHEPVRVAYQDAVASTTKQICLHCITSTPKAENPFHYATGAAHHIFIDQESPFVHHAIVHELGHALLAECCYERIVGPLSLWAQEILSNDLQHVEIFRRMEAYGLEMAPYWTEWEDKFLKSARQIGARDMVSDPFASYMHFPRIFSWLFVAHASGPALGEYRKVNPGLLQAAEAAFDEAKQYGFAAVETNRQSLEVFQRHWTRFCEGLFPNDICGQAWIKKVRACHLKKIGDSFDGRPADDIFKDLHAYGLVQPSR